jgi:hypothetical protein
MIPPLRQPDRQGGRIPGPWINVTANQHLVIDRGATQAQPWTPARG